MTIEASKIQSESGASGGRVVYVFQDRAVA